MWCVLIVFLVIDSPVHAQPRRTVQHSLLAQELAASGFENIVARTSEAVTLVAFEDSRYRFSRRGMQEGILRSIFHLPSRNTKVVFVVQKYGIPIVTLESTRVTRVTSAQHSRPLAVPLLSQSPASDRLNRALPRWPRTNASRFKTDVIVHPDFKARLGEYDNPVAVQVNLKPELRTQLADGLVVSASLLVPLYNELDRSGDYVRVGPSHLNVLNRLRRDTFWFVNLGYFYDNRYGVHGGIRKYVFRGKILLDARAGYTGYAEMDKGIFLYDPPQDVTYSVSGTLFMRRLQLFLKAGYHQFIFQDQGFRFDLYRFFREFRFGLWATTSDNELNGGFRLSIPLPPRQYGIRQYVRLRPSSYFDIGYQGKRNSTAGRVLRANELFDDMLIRHHPAYLETQLGRLESK